MSKIYLYVLPIRIWHGLNALFCILLILSGISMQYLEWFRLIPFNWSITIHNISGILLSFNYVFFLMASFKSGNFKYYKWRLKGLFSDVMKQIIYYTQGIFKGLHEPFPVNSDRKFNPLQLLVYWKLMYILIPLVIISGMMLLFPEYFLFTLGGIRSLILIDGLHILAGFFISIIFIVHVYLALLGGKKNMIAITKGWHDL